ncbi:hypothetical protein [Fodinicurvata sp. EGI_FJ10296]|uniref:hypothetical protein n=1 Tax=Fodinicurvata sp. EGI_FJ10296 TaxID=3231908 RepID=UPI003451D433
MKALKILTAVMGVMILLGVSIIIVELIHRTQSPDPASPDAAPVTASVRPASGEAFAASVEIPAGAALAGTEATADHLILILQMPDATTLFKVVDLRTGDEIGTVGVPAALPTGDTGARSVPGLAPVPGETE